MDWNNYMLLLLVNIIGVLVLFAFLIFFFLSKKNSPQHKKTAVTLKTEVIPQPTPIAESGLPNGMLFNEMLSKATHHAARRQQLLAVMMIDIDKFHKIYNKFGEQHAQNILTEIGKRLSKVIRREDLLAKLEGDTFILLLEDIKKPKFSSMVAKKIIHAFTSPFNIANKTINATASIGISIYPHDAISLEGLIDKASVALFKAKRQGGNQYQFSSEEFHVEALEYIQLDSALRKALHNNELALYYQPIYRIKTGSIAGVEALMRWEHPVLGLIEPARFIPLAEESGLITSIGTWALREAAQQILFWQKEGYAQLSVALKLSPKQFHNPDIDKIIKKTLADIEVDPGFIEIEITEKTLMENIQVSEPILKKIKATGVQISIDHFGVGYTSIQYLKQFPLSAIRIDKSYIKGLPNHPDDIAITNAIIALAHQLALEVIAEGVETAEQIQHLLQQNCDLVQGYYLGHPLKPQMMTMQLRKLQEEVLM